jgi:hypothetical protein
MASAVLVPKPRIGCVVKWKTKLSCLRNVCGILAVVHPGCFHTWLALIVALVLVPLQHHSFIHSFRTLLLLHYLAYHYLNLTWLVVVSVIHAYYRTVLEYST